MALDMINFDKLIIGITFVLLIVLTASTILFLEYRRQEGFKNENNEIYE